MNPLAATAVDLARAQFATTSLYHFLFVPLTLGLGPIVAIFQTLWHRTGNEAWLAADDSAIEAALHRASILDWVRELPDGLDTLLGEEGRELSGGQRQRIVLARALLADAPILVLDEPTAHLDPATAERLLADVLATADGASVLLITHRPEGLDLMDEVVVLGERLPVA